jgi:hypothetical protein
LIRAGIVEKLFSTTFVSFVGGCDVDDNTAADSSGRLTPRKNVNNEDCFMLFLSSFFPYEELGEEQTANLNSSSGTSPF